MLLYTYIACLIVSVLPLQQEVTFSAHMKWEPA